MIRSYHRWLALRERNTLKKGSLYSASTDDILDDMEVWFQEPRSILKDVLGAWDGTAESVGENSANFSKNKSLAQTC